MLYPASSRHSKNDIKKPSQGKVVYRPGGWQNKQSKHNVTKIIHAVIVTSLISTGLYDISLKDKDAFNYGSNVGGIDLEGFKVLTATVTHGFAAVCILICFLAANIVRCAKVLPTSVTIIILLFTFIFNSAGCACLWLHRLPNFPDGYARSILANAILSSASLLYNIVIVVVYCYLRPPLDSAEWLGAQPGAQPAAQKAPAKKKSLTESKEKVKSADSAEVASDEKIRDKAAGLKEPLGPSIPTTNSAESKESKEKANIPQPARSKPADPTQSGKDKKSVQKSVKSEVIAPKKSPMDENLYSMDIKNVKTQRTMDMADKDYFSTT